MLNFFSHHVLIQGDYKLAQITVLDQIGRGNSHVYTALIHNTPYALKQIQIKTDYQYQNFLTEITNMRELSELSADMIRYYGYFVTSVEINQYARRRYAYIVMECAEMNLQNLIVLRAGQGRRFGKGEVMGIVEFLIGGFGGLERCRVAHCDIKPENILVLSSEKMTMKICDVGSCKIIDRQSIQQATIFGTVPFFAPQLIKTKSKKITSPNIFKSDVFSFGLVILYVITFKKFTTKQRIQIDQRAYFEIISQWIKQAREILGYDSRVTEVLKSALEFDWLKRPLFADLKEIYQGERKKKMQMHQAKVKKLQFEENEKNKKIQENFVSIPTSKISLFKSRNLTTKITTRTTSIGFPKISRNYQRLNNNSPGHNSPGLSPVLSKRSSCFATNSPQKHNNTILDYKKIIYFTQQQKQSIPFQFLNMQQKTLVLLTSGLPMQTPLYTPIKKLDIISIYSPCSLSALYELSTIQANKLYIQYQNFQGVGVGSDCPVLSVRKIYANLRGCELVGGYRYLFRAFCWVELEVLEIDVTGSDVGFEEVMELLERLGGRSLKGLGIVWENNVMEQEKHTMLCEKIAKISCKKLTLILNQNFIKHQKQSRYPLPKPCQTLHLSYHSNFLTKQISTLCLSILNSPIKELFLNFSNNNLTKSQFNMIFKSMSSMPGLEKLVLNFSWNPIADISYVIGSMGMGIGEMGQMDGMRNVGSLEVRLNHTGIPQGQVFEVIGAVSLLFQRNLKILKIAYDRNMRREEFYERVGKVLEDVKGIKIDVVGYDNKYFMVYIKKSNKSNKSKAMTGKIKGQKSNALTYNKPQDKQQLKPKPGNCQSLFTTALTFQNYLCLTCSNFSELSKTEHYCKYCIENCKHKGHNIVKVYERSRCCCAYSGCCASDVARRICAEELKIRRKRMYQCGKCERRYCLACVGKCMDGHGEWVEGGDGVVVFQCMGRG